MSQVFPGKEVQSYWAGVRAVASPKTLGAAGKEVNPRAKSKADPLINVESPELGKPKPEASLLEKQMTIPTSAALGVRGQKRTQ